jgi:CheY-like chemotaxis protein
MPKRILIVDDDPVVTRLTGRALSRAGFEVLVAENGKRALGIITEQSVDLLITDLMMPEMEGLEMIRVLHKSRPLLPIVAISGAFDGQFLKVAVALGARAALAKPLSMAKLLETVQQLLGPAGAEPENPQRP